MVNTFLDRLPRREVRLGNTLVYTWRLTALAGLVSGFAVGMVTAALHGVPLATATSAGAAALAAYVAYVVVHHRFARQEVHVLFEGMAITLAAALVIYPLAGLDPLVGLDIHMAAFSAIMAWGRMGCLVGGCCHGVTAQPGPPSRVHIAV